MVGGDDGRNALGEVCGGEGVMGGGGDSTGTGTTQNWNGEKRSNVSLAVLKPFKVCHSFQ